MKTESGNVTYIDVPNVPPLGPARLMALALWGAVLSPVYWALAYRYRTPGLRFRKRCTRMSLKALMGMKSAMLSRTVYNLWAYPMDSTRYFEFDTLWDFLSIPRLAAGKYLDISSPRVFPAAVLTQYPQLDATILNPDAKDLRITRLLAGSLGIGHRCNFVCDIIGNSICPPDSIDLITSISVLEHIPADKKAISAIWSMLKPQGTLLLTVPCARSASEQYISKNYYGLYHPDNQGYVFWQRFYDRDMLQERIFSITGAPEQMAIFGEKCAGLFFENARHKRASRYYPFWKEPVMVGQNFRTFDSIQDLPGEGVVAMKLTKS